MPDEPSPLPPGARRVALIEASLGAATAVVGCIPGWLHYRHTDHVSGIATAVAALAFCVLILIGGLSWPDLTQGQRRWVRRGGHLIAIVLVAAIVIALLALSDGDFPTFSGVGSPGGSRPRKRDSARRVAIILGLLFALVGAIVGGAIADALTHSDAATLVGIVLGIAVPAYGAYRLARRRDKEFRVP